MILEALVNHHKVVCVMQSASLWRWKDRRFIRWALHLRYQRGPAPTGQDLEIDGFERTLVSTTVCTLRLDLATPNTTT